MLRQRGAVLVTALWLALASLVCAERLDEATKHYCAGPCSSSGASASLAFSLRGSGAHRELTYRLTITCLPSQRSGDATAASGAARASAASTPPPPPAVGAVLLQTLPPAVFADIYQLDNAAALSQGPAAQLFGPVDVESIERYSQPTVLAVLCRANTSAAAEAKTQVPPSCTAGAELVVPLHARYPHPQHAARQAGSWWQAALSVPVVTELAPPLVLVQCPGSSSGSIGKEGQWQVAQLEAEALPQPVRWERPAGNLQHGPLVAGGTAAALLLGVAVVLRALCRPLGQESPAQQRRRPKRD
ncbi:hypothetical protein ABPG75_013834 [Micractinium tetrahymenae]